MTVRSSELDGSSISIACNFTYYRLLSHYLLDVSCETVGVCYNYCFRFVQSLRGMGAIHVDGKVAETFNSTSFSNQIEGQYRMAH